jgi:hypothetical protein
MITGVFDEKIGKHQATSAEILIVPLIWALERTSSRRWRNGNYHIKINMMTSLLTE